jgi:nucleoside-diphosphate-sugar epimerase
MAQDSEPPTVAGQRALVMGASGNVGACVTRHLVSSGADVRVLVRKSSDTKGIDGLDVEWRSGDIFDTEAVAAAMADRNVVYYCVVDTRAELRDPAPLFKTNVDGLRNVLDVAVHANLRRFVFPSTIGTIAVGRNGETVDEDTLGMPIALLYGVSRLSDAVAALVQRDFPISRRSTRLVDLTSPANHGKATRELGWHPAPTEEFIARAARTCVERSASINPAVPT